MIRSVRRAISQVLDRLYGYDVFVAHRRFDGAGYATRLVERLDKEKLSSFIDKREYGPGDDLPASTYRHIQMATMLVVVASPEILVERDPDWVLAEIETYIEAHPDDRKLLPIDFGGTLQKTDRGSRIVARLRDTIRIEEPLGALAVAPSNEVIHAIVHQFRKRKRDRVRLRIFQLVAATLALLAASAATLAWLANRSLQEARRNLATNYMTAAKSRLESGYRDEATALAAESLRHYDTAEARRLIVENPPLDLSDALQLPEAGAFAFAIDAVNRRVASAGYQGFVTVSSLDKTGVRRSKKLSNSDFWGAMFTPDGSRLLLGDEKGNIFIVDPDTLADSGCARPERLPDSVDAFTFIDGGKWILVRASASLYLVGNDRGCPAGPFRLLYGAPEAIDDCVFDEESQRVVLTQHGSIVAVPIEGGSAGRAEVHELPKRPGTTDYLQPIRLARHPKRDLLAVICLFHDTVLFLDRDFQITDPLEVRPFGPRGLMRVSVFGFDSNGDRVIITDENGDVFIWSLSDGKLERHLRKVGGSILLPDLLITAAVRMIPIDPSWSKPVAFSRAAKLTQFEDEPSSSAALAGTYTSGVLSVDLRTGKPSILIDEKQNVRGVARPPDQRLLAYYGGVRVTVMKDGKCIREESFAKKSPTGVYSAAWLDDRSALVVGLGWAAPVIIPADARLPLVEGPNVLNGTVDKIVAGPGGYVLLKVGSQTFMWDTHRNELSKIDLVGDEHAALSDIERWGPAGVAVLTRVRTLFWHWGSGSLRPSRTAPIKGDRFALSSNGNRLALFKRWSVQIYDLPTGNLRCEVAFPGPGELYTAALAPDGSILVAARDDGPTVIWSLVPLDKPALEVAEAVQHQTGRVKSDFTVTVPPPTSNSLTSLTHP
jgi:hypothetical protein